MRAASASTAHSCSATTTTRRTRSGAASTSRIESRLEIANFNPLTPTPGSALYARLHAQGRMLSPHWWLEPDYRYGAPIFAPRLMSPPQLAEGCFEAKRAFYAWSSIARRVLDNDNRFSWFSTGYDGHRQSDLAPRGLSQTGAAARRLMNEPREAHPDKADDRPPRTQPVCGRGAHGTADAGCHSPD